MTFLVVDPCMVVKVRSPQSNSVALRVGEYKKNLVLQKSLYNLLVGWGNWPKA
jgi:hypothetical protein